MGNDYSVDSQCAQFRFLFNLLCHLNKQDSINSKREINKELGKVKDTSDLIT